MGKKEWIADAYLYVNNNQKIEVIVKKLKIEKFACVKSKGIGKFNYIVNTLDNRCILF